MSDYGYDDGRHRHRSSRTRDPEYVSETTYIQRGSGQPSRELVYRPREDSIEDIPRDFPPGTEYRRTKIRDEYEPRRTRSVDHRDRYDDDYAYVGPAAAGAAAGYAAARGRGRHGRDDEYYSDYEPPRRERRKSKVGEVLEDLGLGGVAAAVLGRSRSRSRPRGERSRSGDREHDRSHDARKKWQQAAKAAIIAGATEAVRSRNEPGAWTGAKGQRVATAALGAAGIDGLLDRNPESKSKRHIVEAVLGGLAANRLANGPRSRSGSRGRSRSRGRSLSRSISRSLSRPASLFSRSKSRGRSGSRGRGLKEVATLGGVAAVGKAIYDRVRSKSRGRARSHSSDSGDEYAPSRRNRYNDTRGAPDDNRVGRPRDPESTDLRKRDSSSDSTSSTDLEHQRRKMKGKELLTAGLAAVATIHAAHGVYSSMVASEKRHKMVMEGDMSPEEARKRKSKNMLQDAAAVGIAALGIKSAFSEWKEMNEHRHGIRELEEKRRKRRKLREKRQRERQQDFQNMANPYMAYPAPAPAYGYYADGNPYAASGTLPPPPMGAVPARY